MGVVGRGVEARARARARRGGRRRGRRRGGLLRAARRRRRAAGDGLRRRGVRLRGDGGRGVVLLRREGALAFVYLSVGAFVVNSPGARGLPAERYAGTKPDSEVRTPRRVPRHLESRELARRAAHASRPPRRTGIFYCLALLTVCLPGTPLSLRACSFERRRRPAATRASLAPRPRAATNWTIRCLARNIRVSPRGAARLARVWSDTRRDTQARHHKLSERAKSHRLSTAGDTYIRLATACSSTPALCRTALCAGGLQLSVAHTSVHRDTVLECARDVRCKAHPRL